MPLITWKTGIDARLAGGVGGYIGQIKVFGIRQTFLSEKLHLYSLLPKALPFEGVTGTEEYLLEYAEVAFKKWMDAAGLCIKSKDDPV